MKLTFRKRFYLVGVLALATVYSGVSTGFEPFFRLGYILALTVVLSLAWTWSNLRALRVVVDRRSRRVRVGDAVEERITVDNPTRLPKSLLEVADPSDLPGYHNGVAVSVGGRAFRSWRTSAPARKRGVYTLGPVRVRSSDPFGLFSGERVFGETDELTVYPRTVELRGFALPVASLSGDASMKRRTHDLTPHAASVRDYAFGDSLSRVHWNTTARMGKLMSKEFDLGRSGDVWVFIDLQGSVQAGELEESTDEYAVTIGASVANKYLEAGVPVGLVAHGDVRYYLPSQTGPAQMDRVMTCLASCKAEGQVSLAAALAMEERMFSHHSALVVITPSHVAQWAVALRELARRRVGVVAVVLDGFSFGGVFGPREALTQLEAGGIPSHLVRRGDDLAEALGRGAEAPRRPPQAGRGGLAATGRSA